jgi:hypothetical protein
MKRNFLFFITFITFIIICYCKKGEIHIQEEKNANNFKAGQMQAELLSFVQVNKKKTSIKTKLENKIKKSSNEKINLNNKIEVKVIEKKSNDPDISLQPKIPSLKQRKNNLYPI